MNPLKEDSTVEIAQVTAADGVNLSVRWDRVADPIAHVVVAHGFAEYTRRQVNLAEALVSAGMSVLRYDMRGHGHSGGRRGHVERFDDYVDDLCDMVERARTPDVPLYVVGHSQGGLITTRAMMQGRLRADAVVLSNPALQQAFKVPGWKLVAAKVLSRGLPKVALPTGLNADQLSTNSEANADYAADPLIFGSGTTRWGWEYICAQADVADGVLRPPCPVLVSLGLSDPVIDAAYTRSWLGKAQESSITVLTYPKLMHELFNEPKADRDHVLAELSDWLVAQTN